MSLGKISILTIYCHIKPNLFLQTKIPENLLLAKYLISVAATLIDSVISHDEFVLNNIKKMIKE